MNTNTLLSRSEDYLSNEIDGEVVMMNIETGAYASLNATGKSIWELLSEPKQITEIVRSLTAEYAISEEQCMNEVVPFLTEMVKNNILKVQN